MLVVVLNTPTIPLALPLLMLIVVDQMDKYRHIVSNDSNINDNCNKKVLMGWRAETIG